MGIGMRVVNKGQQFPFIPRYSAELKEKCSAKDKVSKWIKLQLSDFYLGSIRRKS